MKGKWMSLYKKLLFCAVLGIALCSSNVLFAQGGERGGGGGRGDTAAMRKRQEEMLQQVKTDLKLTDTQTDSVSSIQKEFQGKMRAIFIDESVSREDKRAKMEPLNDERNKRLQAALGDDLFKKYQAWVQEHRPQRGGGGGGGRIN
ncbi:hypothetical protein ACX0G9_05895 [Flavitalea flava]